MASLMNKSDVSSVVQAKQVCRSILKHKRQAISQERQQEAALSAYQALKKQTEHANWVLSYASFKTELDVWKFNEELAEQNKLVLPKVKDSELKLFHVPHLKALQVNQWGLLEPDPCLCLEIKPEAVSLAFIPGLGFDIQTGHRLGYGKGYYDRFLKQSSFGSICYGLGFREQEIINLPFTTDDHPLTAHFLF